MVTLTLTLKKISDLFPSGKAVEKHAVVFNAIVVVEDKRVVSLNVEELSARVV